MRRTGLVAALLSLALPAAAQDLASFEKRVTRQDAPQRADAPRRGAAGGAGLLVLHPRRRRAPTRRCRASPASRTCSSTWPSRAPTASAPTTTRPRRRRSTRSRPPTTPTTASARRPVGRDQAKVAGAGARPGRTPSPRPTATSRPTSSARSSTARAASGLNAFTSTDDDRLLLLAARQPPRAVGLPRVGALPEARLPRVLQGARRGERGAAHAHREQPHRAGSSSSSSPPPSPPTPTASPAVG